MHSYFSEPTAARGIQKEVTSSKNSYRTAQNKTSVRKNDNAKELDLGKLVIYVSFSQLDSVIPLQNPLDF